MWMQANWEKPLRSAVRAVFQLIWKYLRVEVQGIEHIPKKGPVIIYANHSGWSGFDAVMLAFCVFQMRRRIPRMIAHRFWFSRPWMAVLSHKFGLVKAQVGAAVELLEKNHIVIIFPEGEQGNFKPSSEMYQLQPFHSGIVRIALTTGVPVIPCTIIGAEETHINLASILVKNILPKGITLPLPLLFLPLPARWRIGFHPLIDPTQFKPTEAHDPFKVERIARLWRKKLQIYLYRELKKRPGVFIDRERWLQFFRKFRNS